MYALDIELYENTNQVEAPLYNFNMHIARTAEEVFVTSTAGGIMPITKIDGRVISSGTHGSVT